MRQSQDFQNISMRSVSSLMKWPSVKSAGSNSTAPLTEDITVDDVVSVSVASAPAIRNPFQKVTKRPLTEYAISVTVNSKTTK